MYTGFVVLTLAAVLAACTTRPNPPGTTPGPMPSAFLVGATPSVAATTGTGSVSGGGTAAIETPPASVAPAVPPAQAGAQEPLTPQPPSSAPARPAKPGGPPRPRTPATRNAHDAHDAHVLGEALTALAHHCDTAAHDLVADFLHGRPGARPLPLSAPKLRVEQGWKVYRSLPLLPLSVKRLPVREVSLLQLPDVRGTGLSIGFDAPLARARAALEELQHGARNRPELLVDGGRAAIYCVR